MMKGENSKHFHIVGNCGDLFYFIFEKQEIYNRNFLQFFFSKWKNKNKIATKEITGSIGCML
jgi:hypothetical protein